MFGNRIRNLKNKLKLLVRSQDDDGNGLSMTSTEELEGYVITPNRHPVIFKCNSRKKLRAEREIKQGLLPSLNRLLIIYTQYKIAS